MRHVILATLAVGVSAALEANADTQLINGIEWTYTVLNGEASVGEDRYSQAVPTSTTGTIAIPTLLGGYPVTSIGDYAFYNCSGLTSITIPDSVTSIGERAFYNCSGLTSITLPDSVTSIGEYAFACCYGLASITIPDSVTSIDENAFYHCKRLRSITIPDSVQSIGNGAFSYCSVMTAFSVAEGNPSFRSQFGLLLTKDGKTLVAVPGGLTSVTIPNGVTSIGDDACFWCEKMTTVTIPDSVTSIGEYAFACCYGLASITIPDSVTSIGEHAFSNCPRLTSITIPDGVTSIEHGAFVGCSGLTSVTIPNGVTSIGSSAFYDCSGLTSVMIPNGVTSIGDHAFYNCSGLKSLTIPDSVTSIGRDAFSGCSGLETLYLPRSYSGTPSVPSGCTIIRCDPISLSVVSERGGTNPSPGMHDIMSNLVVTCSAPAFIPDSTDPDMRIACLGWAGTGSVPASGTGTSVSFTLHEASSITWLWGTQIRIGGDAGSADVWGTVPGEEPWFAVGDATAPDGFSLRSGEVAQGGTNTLESTVVGPGLISFSWKIAANRNDFARFYVDGTKQAEITRSAGWAAVGPIELGPGEHALRWTFERGSTAGGAAFLDDVCWQPRHALSVSSTDGTPTPAAGTHDVYWGAEVAANVAAPVPTAGGKTRRVCTGWTGTGSVPASGTGTNVTFMVEGDSSLTWNWRTEHWIDVAVASGGSTSFRPQWAAEGSTVSVSLSPNWSLCDIALSGDTNGVTVSGPTLSVPADGPRTIRVTITRRKVSLVVSTPMGTVTPAPGTHTHSYGDSVTASAVSPLSESGGVQVVCAGWTGTGSVPSSGTGTNVTFTVEEDSSIAWKWATNVWIDVAVSGGSTSFAPRWVRKGTTAEIELTPATHLFTVALSGDVADGVELDGTTLRVLADKPRTIRATIGERKISLAVSSAFGTASPAVGTHVHSCGDAVTANVAAPPEEDGTRRICTGWTGTGSVPPNGSGSSVLFTMEEDSSLTWNWRTDYRLSLETKGPVEADFEADWHTAGTTLDVVFDVLFEGDCGVTLGGDTNGVALDAAARTITIPCNGPRDIVLTAQPLSLAEALDVPELVWTSEGGNAWTPQTKTTADGEDAAASGPAGTAGGGDSVLSTALAGPGTLSWSWRLETAGGSGIDLVVDDATPHYIESDRAGGWVEESVLISGEGHHAVQFVFWNEMGSAEDRGFVDCVSWSGAAAGADETATTPVPVPHEWLVNYGLVSAGASGEAFEAAALATAENGRPVWECYVAGLDPTKEDDFRAFIDMDDGEPVVTWWPSNVAGRIYTVWGKADIADEWSCPIEPSHRFFQVRVALGSASGVDESAWPGSVVVTFDAAGGTVDPTTRTYDAPGALGSLPVPVRDGYDFFGWRTRATGGVEAAADTAVPWCDWTLVATWAPALYMVVDLSGGASAASYPVSYLADVPDGGWTDEYKTTKLVMRRIEAGTFTMGSPSDETGRNSSNEDRHPVALTKPFFIGVFEVTQKQWALVMGSNPSSYKGETRPVEYVSYNGIRGSSSGAGWPSSSAVDATSFMGKLRARTGLEAFDLPTEAQWEYACRAGTTTALNSGMNLTNTVSDASVAAAGRYSYNTNDVESGYSQHMAVGSYLPNAWGLYDMHGNVREWCLDWHVSSLGTSTAIDPVGASSGTHREARGGSWKNDARYCRSATRGGVTPPSRGIDLGFRLSMVLPESTIPTYSVSFDANGGEGTMPDQTFAYGIEQELSTNVFTRTGYAFAGWATNATGEAVFMDGQAVSNLTATAGGSVTLYAIWTANTYTVKFNANGGSGTMANQSFAYGTAQALSANAFTRTGYTFEGWAMSATGPKTYDDKQSVSNLTSSAGGSETLYAVWTANAYTVRFDANGGEGTMPDQTFAYGIEQALTANAFTRTSHTFMGWAPNAIGEAVFTDGQSVSNLSATAGGSVTLFAVWHSDLSGVQLWENGPYWAECNVGATKPEEYGYYFWWGDTVGYTVKEGMILVSSTGEQVINDADGPFTSWTCPTLYKDNSQLLSEGWIDSTGNLVAAHDAATAHLGSPWRMPTVDELYALVRNSPSNGPCTSVWITTNGVPGKLVTGKGAYANKSIFLPAASHCLANAAFNPGSRGFYWSSTVGVYSHGMGCIFMRGSAEQYGYNRYYGFPVRPVRGCSD